MSIKDVADKIGGYIHFVCYKSFEGEIYHNFTFDCDLTIEEMEQLIAAAKIEIKDLKDKI